MTSSTNSSVDRGFGLLDLPTHLPNASSSEAIDKPVLKVAEPEPVTEQVLEPIGPSHLVTESPLKSGNSSPEIKEGKKKIFIQNTNISLDTEEDIQKWIAERRKNWPTRKNVEAKEEAKKLDVESGKKRVAEGLNSTVKKHKRICNFYSQHGRCKFGNKCKNVHEEKSGNKISTDQPIDSTTGTSNNAKKSLVVRTINGVKVSIPQRFHSEYYGNANASLSNMLLHKENMAGEGAKILDFIRYLNKLGLIDHDVTFN